MAALAAVTALETYGVGDGGEPWVA